MNYRFFKPALALTLGVIVSLGLYIITTQSVSGQEGTGAVWNTRCNPVGEDQKEERCEVFQRLVIKDTGQRLVELAIGYPPEAAEGAARGVMILPLGILLETGVFFKIDDSEPFRFSPRYCEQGGCVAFLNMNDKIMKMMRKGNVATISMKALSGQDINVEMSLKGFSKAVDQLK